MSDIRKFSLRFISIISVLVILMSCIVVPAYAAEEETSQFFDVLDFGTANGSGNQYVSAPFPAQVVYQTIAEPFRYIDMLVTSDVPDLTINYAGTNLTSVLLSNNGLYRYRFYGNLVGDTSGYLIFTVNGSSGSTVIFESMKISKNTFNSTYYPEVGSILVNPFQYAPTEDMTYPGNPAMVTLKQESAVNFYKDYSATLYIDNWQAYDYVDVIYRSRCGTIDSIEVELNNIGVPHTISFLDSSLAPDTSWDDNEMYGDIKMFDVLIHLDFTNFDRTNSSSCLINIKGQYAPYWSNQYCMLNSITGIVLADPTSPLGTLWSRIQGLFVGLFSDLKLHLTSLLRPDQEGQDVIDDTNTELDDFESEIGDLPDVDIDEALPDPSYFDDVADINAFAEFFRNLVQNPIIYNSMRITLGFCLISFLWFGRR